MRSEIVLDQAELLAALSRPRDPIHIVLHPHHGLVVATGEVPGSALRGMLPALYPEWLGDRSFAEAHACRFPYIVGEMARGIATSRMVIAAARAGLMGFFGSAGLDRAAMATGLGEIKTALGAQATNWGANLIHTPGDAGTEMATVALFQAERVPAVSASAFMALAPSIVRYAASGLTRRGDGTIQRSGAVFAKVSRPEVAAQFMNPPPERLLRELVAAGHLTAAEAELAALLPVAEDVTVEADSGGHTDNRPLTALLPAILHLRDTIQQAQRYGRRIRVGAAGGLGTPAAVAAAFALGAAYVLTGSINQVAVESGLSADGRALLAAAEIADVAMAPAADMFELGIQVQVLKRGTLFAQRARKLWEIYRANDGLDTLASDVRRSLEQELFRESLDQAWARTRAYFETKDPREIARAEREPKHRMALVFRSYLFNAAQWAREGRTERRGDYQIWCGPAMGAFNDWTRGSFLEQPEQRTVAQIARNLLEGAAVITRAQQLRTYGVDVPAAAFSFTPRPLR
jgi:trans-AT polyketide synthase/acyltransferase/oxidoreductase domain-containing protein